MLDFITKFFEGINNFLEWFNTTTLPEETGVALAKSLRFFIDDVAPVINDYIVMISSYFGG